MRPKISVIIPIYNEEDVIVECLTSLTRQIRKDIEIIVVDDGSRDKTWEVLSKFKIQNSKFKILRQGHRGPGPARNLGAKHATGKILVFVDADMTFAPDFIEKLIQPIENRKAKGTFSKEEYASNPQNVWSRCWGINENWENGKRHPKNYPDRQRVFRAILKTEFDRVGGFSPTGEYTDDWTLSEKLGYLAEAAPNAVFYHKNPETLPEVFLQAKWIGKRQHKLGKTGTLIAILRASLPISLVTGIFKATQNTLPQFLIFKIIYDLGILTGAIVSLFGGSSAK